MTDRYNFNKFKKDLKRIKRILPKELKKVSVNFLDYGLANFSNGINFNYKGLIFEKDLKRAFEKYLRKKLDTRTYFKYVILHEYGHAYRHITGEVDYKRYRQEEYFFEPKEKYIDRQLDYWTKITEEIEAMKFAKRYIKR